jgi:hypothetical protein
VQQALHDSRQGLLYGFWVVQRYGFEPTLAGALGNSFGVALVLAVVKIAEAQSAARWALAAGAVFVPVLAFGCVGDGHRFFVRLWVECYPPPPAFCKLFRISGFAGFRPQSLADKGFGSSPHGTRRMEPDLFSRTLHDVRGLARAQVEMSHGGRGKLMFCFAVRVA